MLRVIILNALESRQEGISSKGRVIYYTEEDRGRDQINAHRINAKGNAWIRLQLGQELFPNCNAFPVGEESPHLLWAGR